MKRDIEIDSGSTMEGNTHTSNAAHRRMMPENDKYFVFTAIGMQIVIMIFYGIGIDYNTTKKDGVLATDESMEYYSTYQDVHVMMLIGFGFLMTFLKKYGFSAISYNLLITVIGLEWGMFLFNWIGTGHLFDSSDAGGGLNAVVLETINLIDGDIAAAAVLISFGAILGRASPTQLLWLTFIELIIYSINFYICVEAMHINDVGGSIVVHTFGAYFGLAVSYMLGEPKTNEDDNGSVYHSDLFSMIGTLFLVEYSVNSRLFCFVFGRFYCDLFN